MTLIADLKQFFTAAKVAKAIEVAAPVRATVQDEFFPEASRQQHDMPLIPFSELKTMVDCVPIVSRSGEAYPFTDTQLDTQYIEPLPVRVRSTVRAMELNNLKLLNMGQKQSWANRKIQNGRTAVKKTIEALCAQAVFDGAINYPLILDNGQFARYKVGYGSEIQELTVESGDKWDASGTTLAKVYLQLEDMDTLLEDSGHGGDKVVYAGKKAYAQLLVLVETNNAAKQAKVPARLTDDGAIVVGGHTVKKMAETWKDPETGSSSNKVPDKEIRMVAKGNQGFFYAAIDDLEANLQAMPMFTKPLEITDPSELRLVSTSKPLPAVAPEATCKAVVMS
jgi:hypothetical protein